MMGGAPDEERPPTERHNSWALLRKASVTKALTVRTKAAPDRPDGQPPGSSRPERRATVTSMPEAPPQRRGSAMVNEPADRARSTEEAEDPWSNLRAKRAPSPAASPAAPPPAAAGCGGL